MPLFLCFYREVLGANQKTITFEQVFSISMLQQLKRYSGQKKLKGFLRERSTNSEKKHQQTGIILDLDLMEKGFEVSTLRKELGFDGENFQFMVCGKSNPVSEKYSLETFDDKNLGWNGVFKTDSKERLFQEMEYKLLLNYFNQPSPELLIFSASVKANLKVGFPMAEKRLNDLEIAVDPKNYRLFATELKKYLTAMKW